MRALVIKNFECDSNTFILEGKKAHHLLNVIRIKVNEHVSIIDGNGSTTLVKVLETKKKKIEFKVLKSSKETKAKLNISVAFGLTKKESFELSIKQLIEIGVNNITILNTEYSQRYDLKPERLASIIESSMEQSNQSYYPEVKFQKFDDFLSEAKNIIYFSSIGTKLGEINVDNNTNYNLVFGPEGGLSASEEEKIKNLNSTIIHLPTNIMRTSTAVCFCSGYVLSKLGQ